TLSWDSVQGASSYKVRITKIGAFTEYSTSYTVQNLSNGGYYWDVAASNDSGDSGWSDPKRFDVNIQGDFWFVGDLPPDMWNWLGANNEHINVELRKGNSLKTSGKTDYDGDFDKPVDYVYGTGTDYKVKAWKDGYRVSSIEVDDKKVTTGNLDAGEIDNITIKEDQTTKVKFNFDKTKAAAGITLSSPSLPASIRNIDSYKSYAAALRKGAPPLAMGTATEVAPLAEAAPLTIVPVLKTGETLVHLLTTRDVSVVPSLSYTIEGVHHEPQGIALTGSGSDFEGRMYIESTTPDGTATFHYYLLDETGSASTQIEYGKEFVIDTTIYPEQGGESSNRDRSLAKLPAGALKCPVNIRITNTHPNNPDKGELLSETASMEIDRLTLTCLPRTGRQFSARIDGKEEEVSMSLKKFTICLPYLDIDDDGLVDNINLPEEKLRMVYKDAAAGWRIADQYTIDAIANKVTAEVTSFTEYMLASIADIITVDKIITYPNPWHPNRGGLIKISYIPINSQPEIRIYNIAGELVRTLHNGKEIVPTDRGYMEADWDGKNDSGDNVASGIYLYLVRCNKGEKTGKIGIIR
ncbi:MAG: FlgD immunoglobulin-like domain containing protein, partial [Candidatus Desantisbacteria bacterium]